MLMANAWVYYGSLKKKDKLSLHSAETEMQRIKKSKKNIFCITRFYVRISISVLGRRKKWSDH